MKYLYSLLATTLVFSLFSCGKEAEEMPQNGKPELPGKDDEFYILPEDTAGIVIPQGHMLAIFPGPRKTGTRAPITGKDSRITHLQYLVYQKDATGVYKLIEQKTVFNQTGNKTWPYKAVSVLLPNDAGLEYKYVFLGNVDKSAFTRQTNELLRNHQDNYDSARIVMPDEEFTTQNMYYLSKGSFTSDEATNSVIQRNVVLQRIVSRLDITKPPFDVAPTDTYQTAFQKRIVSSVLWNTNREKARGGVFHYAVKDRVLRMVMALTYVATKNNKAAADQAFASSGNKYTVLKYRYGSADNILQSQETGISGIEYTKEKLDKITGGDYAYVDGTDFSNNILLNTAQYLYDLFYEVPGGMASNELSASNDKLTQLLNYFWTKVISIDQYADTPFETLCINQWSTNLGSYVKNSTDAGFKAFFNPVRNCPANIAITVDNMPKAIDFNSNVQETMPVGTILAYQKKSAPDTKSDSYYPLIGLGRLSGLQISKIQYFDGIQTSLTPSVAEDKRGGIWTNGNIPLSIPFSPNKLNRIASGVTSVTVKDRQLFKPKAAPPSTELNYYRGGIESFVYQIIETLTVNVTRGNWGGAVSTAGRKYTITLASGKLCNEFWRHEIIATTDATFTTTTVKTMFKNIADACSSNSDDVTYLRWTYIYMPLPVFDATNLDYSASWSIAEAAQ